MAVLSKTTVANILAHTYSEEKYLAPHERFMTKFWDTVQDFEDGGEPVGTDRIWEVVTGDSHSAVAGAEGADLPTFNAPTSIQCLISALQYMASVAWTDLILSVAKAPGLVTKMNVIDRYVEMTTRNFYQMLNRHTLTHNTARIGVVEATTSSATTFVCRNPEHVLMFRVGLPIDFYDTDTSGSKQAASEAVQAINFETRTITIANARSLTAGWSIYRAGEYGLGMTGLMGIVDNATKQASVFGQARSSYPALNATVLTASGGTQPYSEKLVRKALNRIFYLSGVEATEIWTNRGIIGEHLNSLTGNRIFMQTGDGVPSYQTGAKEEKLGFVHAGKTIPFKVESDLPARALFAIHKPYFRRHILRKPSWIGDDTGADGASSPILMQAPATTTYSTNKIAGLLGFLAMANVQPKANAAVVEIADEELAGDQ